MAADEGFERLRLPVADEGFQELPVGRLFPVPQHGLAEVLEDLVGGVRGHVHCPLL